MEGEQLILTPACGDLLGELLAARREGRRVVAVTPHYNHAAMLLGYVVICDPPSSSSAEAAPGIGERKEPNPCPSCGAFLWSDPRPCWNCARLRTLAALPVETPAPASIGDELERFFDRLRATQAALPPEASRVLMDNLWELYGDGDPSLQHGDLREHLSGEGSER